MAPQEKYDVLKSISILAQIYHQYCHYEDNFVSKKMF